MPASEILAVHRIVESSRANGPGVRTVIWVQGCTLGCPGCANPETHDPDGGTRIPVADIVEQIVRRAHTVEGITLSGGEPLQQAGAVASLLQQVRQRTALSVILFSGYTLPEIRRIPSGRKVLNLTDILIAGRYDRSRRVARGLLASSNQTIHFFSRRYGPADLESVPEAEVLIGEDGSVLVTGIDPPPIKPAGQTGGSPGKTLPPR